MARGGSTRQPSNFQEGGHAGDFPRERGILKARREDLVERSWQVSGIPKNRTVGPSGLLGSQGTHRGVVRTRGWSCAH